MGRLLAIALLVAAAGVAVIVVNGPGTDRPEEEETGAAAPTGETTTVAPDETEGAVEPSGRPSQESVQAGATIRMRRLRFTPTEVSVLRGQAVRFVNDDDVTHNVFQDVGARSGLAPVVDSGAIEPGQTYTYVPRTNGEIAFACTLHPSVMLGQILVEPAAD